MKNIIILLSLYIIFNIDTAYAYLDPGSGSIIVQALIILFASITFYFGKFVNLCKKIFAKIRFFIVNKKR